MTRIALTAGPDPGHTLPIVDLAAALRRAGHDVAVWTGAVQAGTVADAGVEFQELPLVPADGRHADMAFRLWGLAEELAPATAETLAAWRPDVVVTDTLTMSGAFAAELIGVPWIELIPHHLPDPDPALPPIGLGRQPATSALRRLDDARLRRLQERSIAAGYATRDEARRRLGLNGASRRLGRLVATLPGLEYPRARWPGDTHLVGPLGWDPPLEPLAIAPGTEPLVVVTDSTASTVPQGLGRWALDALRNTGVRLVVVTREPLQPWDTGCVVGWGPHAPLFDEASVVVTPGGAGTLGKAFARGLPVVVVPLHGDQFEAAARVEAAGAGRRLRPWQRSARWLRAAVTRVLHDPTYQQAARTLQVQAAELGPDHAARVTAGLVDGVSLVGRGPQR